MIIRLIQMLVNGELFYYVYANNILMGMLWRKIKRRKLYVSNTFNRPMKLNNAVRKLVYNK